MITAAQHERRQVAQVDGLARPRRLDLGLALADQLARAVADRGREGGERLLSLALHSTPDLQPLADRDPAPEVQLLAAVERAGAGQHIAQQSRQQEPTHIRGASAAWSRTWPSGRLSALRLPEACAKSSRSCSVAFALERGAGTDLELVPGRVVGGKFHAWSGYRG